MKKRITPLLIGIFVSLSFLGKSQQFWIENWTGSSCVQLCHTYTGPNGTWTIDSVTANNGTYSNDWYFSQQETGNGRGQCGSGPGTPITAHVGNVANSPSSILCSTGDCGAAYDATDATIITDKRIVSPVINCTGKSTITLSFNYEQGGQVGHDNDTVEYYNGTTWAFLAATPKTVNTGCLGQGRWTYYSVALPVSANNNSGVKIAFHWKNDGDGSGADPSFAVDSIVLSGTSTSGIMTLNDYKNSQLYPNPNNGMFTLKFDNSSPNSSLEIYNVLGERVYQSVLTNTDEHQINLNNQASTGVYLYRVYSADRNILSEGKFIVK